MLGDLSAQRDALNRARNRVRMVEFKFLVSYSIFSSHQNQLRDTGDDLGSSSRVLSTMLGRALTNR